MNDQAIVQLISNALFVTIMVASPLVLVGLAVGIFVSIIQTAISIQEQTLSFVPKVLAMSLATMLMGNWMLRIMTDYTRDIFINMANFLK